MTAKIVQAALAEAGYPNVDVVDTDEGPAFRGHHEIPPMTRWRAFKVAGHAGPCFRHWVEGRPDDCTLETLAFIEECGAE